MVRNHVINFPCALICTVLLFNVTVPPISRSKHVYSDVVYGSSVLLHIKPEGIPEPTLQWYRNGYLLPSHTKAILKIDNVNKSHEGTYTCVLRNTAGTFVWQEAAVVVRNQP